jgi:hypothetical protein
MSYFRNRSSHCYLTLNFKNSLRIFIAQTSLTWVGLQILITPHSHVKNLFLSFIQLAVLLIYSSLKIFRGIFRTKHISLDISGGRTKSRTKNCSVPTSVKLTWIYKTQLDGGWDKCAGLQNLQSLFGRHNRKFLLALSTWAC